MSPRNVSAVYFTTVAFLPLLQAGTESHGHLSASVIVISSMSGIMRHAQGHFGYNAAKGATGEYRESNSYPTKIHDFEVIQRVLRLIHHLVKS